MDNCEQLIQDLLIINNKILQLVYQAQLIADQLVICFSQDQ